MIVLSSIVSLLSFFFKLVQTVANRRSRRQRVVPGSNECRSADAYRAVVRPVAAPRMPWNGKQRMEQKLENKKGEEMVQALCDKVSSPMYLLVLVQTTSAEGWVERRRCRLGICRPSPDDQTMGSLVGDLTPSLVSSADWRWVD